MYIYIHIFIYRYIYNLHIYSCGPYHPNKCENIDEFKDICLILIYIVYNDPILIIMFPFGFCYNRSVGNSTMLKENSDDVTCHVWRYCARSVIKNVWMDALVNG